jgi:UPF0042 nucleotide-binding protein
MPAAEVPDVRYAPVSGRVTVRVLSFGYLWHPNPAELPGTQRLDVVVDLRAMLHNPYHDPAMRERTGLEPVVRDYVLSTPGAMEILASTASLTVSALRQKGPRGLAVTVAFGCAGGRHRSVVLANELHSVLDQAGVRTEVIHHDVLRPVYRRTEQEGQS